MKKKLLAGAITLLSVATLAACSKGSEGADLISMKGDVITEHQFYEQVKNNPSAQQVLLNMTIQKSFLKNNMAQSLMIKRLMILLPKKKNNMAKTTNVSCHKQV